MRTRWLFIGALLLAHVGGAHAQSDADAGIPAPVPPASDVGPHDEGDASLRDAGVSGDAGLDAGEPAEPELPEAHRPRIRVTLRPGSTIRIGSVVTVEVTVSALAGDDVTIPSQSFAPLELHSRRVTERESAGRTESRFVLELLALEAGDFDLSPISLRVLTADGLVGSSHTEAIHLRITSLIANEPNAAPKGPTAPRRLREEDLVPLYVAASIALLLLGAVLAWLVSRWMKRRPKPVLPPPPPRPAWEIAFEKLEELRRDGPAMIAEGRVGPWIDSLSDTVRDYLGQRYGFDGLECTSHEVIHRIASLRLQAAASAEVSVFLGECDLVKFAQASMTEEQADTMFRQAQRIVRTSIPGGASFGSVGGAP